MTTLNQAFKTFNRRQAIEAATINEMLTRQRVEALELKVKDHERKLTALSVWHFGLERQRDSLQGRGFAGLWRRLRWLLTGRSA